LYVGGVFSTIGGRRRANLAALDARAGRVAAWKPAPAGDVATIFVHRGEVLTAGHDGFDVTSAANGRVVRWMHELKGVASAFGTRGPIVYLGGDARNGFTAVAGRPRNNLAAINLVTHRFTPWAPNLARYVTVGKIVPSGGAVLVSGSFTTSLG
jgi:hypothetical protein